MKEKKHWRDRQLCGESTTFNDRGWCSRPNRRSCEEIAELKTELPQRANRLGAGYPLMQAVPEDKTLYSGIRRDYGSSI